MLSFIEIFQHEVPTAKVSQFPVTKQKKKKSWKRYIYDSAFISQYFIISKGQIHQAFDNCSIYYVLHLWDLTFTALIIKITEKNIWLKRDKIINFVKRKYILTVTKWQNGCGWKITCFNCTNKAISIIFNMLCNWLMHKVIIKILNSLKHVPVLGKNTRFLFSSVQ